LDAAIADEGVAQLAAKQCLCLRGKAVVGYRLDVDGLEGEFARMPQLVGLTATHCARYEQSEDSDPRVADNQCERFHGQWAMDG
jgi:hypothetical protein